MACSGDMGSWPAALISSGVIRRGSRPTKPYIKHIEDRLWEMRLRGRDGIARALYVTASGRRVVILRVFVKKTQKTPRREIELARQRAKEVR
jgi:phage-related protein